MLINNILLFYIFHSLQGLPLHVQIDTFEDPRDINVFHRGYCQIKVFCDKVSNCYRFELTVESINPMHNQLTHIYLTV